MQPQQACFWKKIIPKVQALNMVCHLSCIFVLL